MRILKLKERFNEGGQCQSNDTVDQAKVLPLMYLGHASHILGKITGKVEKGITKSEALRAGGRLCTYVDSVPNRSSRFWEDREEVRMCISKGQQWIPTDSGLNGPLVRGSRTRPTRVEGKKG